MPEDDVEVEWQFDALDLRPVERWLAALPLLAPGDLVAPLTAQAKPPRRLTDRYLDTEDWRIGRAGLVLRTRRRGRRDEATLKDLRPAGAGGLRERLEVSEDLPAGGLGGLGDDGPVGWRLAATAGSRPLRQVLEVRTRRRPFSLRVGGEEVAEVALDDTVVDVGAGQPPLRLRRVEVEAVPRWVEALEPLVRDLQLSSGLQPATLSKFEAGLLALGTEIPGPPALGSTAVDGQSTFGDLAFAVLRRHLGVLLASEPGTRLGEDIEQLHDMRVATRRLRAAFDLFADVLPVRAGTLRDELSWLAGVLGDVRDLDVQIDNMDTDAVERDGVDNHPGPRPAETPLDHLRRLLESERRQARRAMLEALDSPRWERLAAGLVALAQQGPSRRTPGARQPAALAVPRLVMDRHRAVTKAARRAGRTGLATDFHRLRIRCKRLRYSLEFVADLYGRRTDRYTRRLAKLQDALGLMHDAEVAAAQLHELATRPGDDLPLATVFAMGGLAENHRLEAAELLSTMGRRLKVVAGTDWNHLADHMEQARATAEAALPPPRARRVPVPPAAPVADTAPVAVQPDGGPPVSPANGSRIAAEPSPVEGGGPTPEMPEPPEPADTSGIPEPEAEPVTGVTVEPSDPVAARTGGHGPPTTATGS
ncbi:MAG TPA: CHAD domain-containing protein [Acidimicrobiales bacterium]|nr:CHAD domain-containing protein [Acidimicrobiales bacterium]